MQRITPGISAIMIQLISSHADTVIHQYQFTGTFNACLVAYNQYECADTACQDVQTLINPAAGCSQCIYTGTVWRKQHHTW